MDRSRSSVAQSGVLPVVWIGIGLNRGCRKQILRQTWNLLSHFLFRIKASPIYETPPISAIPQPPYWNLVIRAYTSLLPWELFRRLKTVERQVQRLPEKRWGAREMDLDLLFYDHLVWRTPELSIPHPRLHERAFVLRPMADIEPTWLHPVYGKTIQELLHDLDKVPDFPKVSFPLFT